MDTKSKSYSKIFWVKAVAFVLCVALFSFVITGIMVFVDDMMKAGRTVTLEEMMNDRGYLYSSEMQREFENYGENLNSLINHYKSREYVAAGKSLSFEEGPLNDVLENMYEMDRVHYGNESFKVNPVKVTPVVRKSKGEVLLYYDINGTEYRFPEEDALDFFYVDSLNKVDRRSLLSYMEEQKEMYEIPGYKKEFIKANQDSLNRIREILVKDQLRAYDKLLDRLSEQKGVTYYVSDGHQYYSNLKGKSPEGNLKSPQGWEPSEKDFSLNPAYMIYKNGQLEKVPADEGKISGNDGDSYLENLFFENYNDDLVVYLGFSQNFIDEKEKAYGGNHIASTLTPLMAVAAGLCAVIFIWLAIVTGGRDEQGRRMLYKADRVFTELQLALVGLCLTAGICITASVTDEILGTELMNNTTVAVLACCVGLISSIGLWFILGLIRLLKAGEFIKCSLSYKIWRGTLLRAFRCLGRTFSSYYRGSSLMMRTGLMIVVCGGLCATVVLAPLVVILLLVYGAGKIKEFEEVKKGVIRLREGDFSYKIPPVGRGELSLLAEDVNLISQSMEKVVESEVKTQRLKAELISHVSHDLKTPLTSMVSYIDLLKKEGLSGPKAPEYLRILDEKTDRLRELTENLFEAAKASSGAIPVELEKVEVVSLLKQGLGEMDHQIKGSELEFLLKNQEEKHLAKADGKLLWRVVENLLGNILKYALAGSRVYLEVRDVEICGKKRVIMEFTNISKNRLTLSGTELMERFKRGDESRNSEGSGLGLAIARDLVKLQKGEFEIVVEGDVFKARVTLVKWEE